MRVLVTRDFGASWQSDTSGLNGSSPNGLELDSSQNVYLATSSGLFRQGLQENIWKPISGLPISYVSQIFIDRKDRIFATGFSTNGRLYISTDRGATWNVDTSGLNNVYLTNFGDDAYGNIYVTTSSAFAPNKMYRSSGGTGSWNEIGQSIRSLAIDSSTTGIFHSITGDSVLLAGTLFGLYLSTDQGNTWAEANQGLPAVNIYNVIKNSDGSVFLSTNRGIYQGVLDDSVWTKRYPVNGFMNGAQLFRDNGGILYTLGPSRTLGYNTRQPYTYRSNDNGKSWTLDTLGLDAIIPTPGSWYVDASGMQHIAVQQYKQRLHLYEKSKGNAWMPDEQGFLGDSSAFGNFVGADLQGNIYLTANGVSWKRSAGSGAWTLDTAGLNSDALGFVVGGKNGEVYTSTYYGGLMHKEGSRWSALPGAAGVASTGVISVDSSGALFALFYRKPGNALVPGGVYFSIDNGTHWTLAGLDSITVTGLISYGDTTYALTNQGIFVLTRNGNSAVRNPVVFADPNIQLSLYPNPSSGRTTIKISSAERGAAKVSVIDLRGEEVATLFTGELEAGDHSFVWDAKNIPAGTYSCIVHINSSMRMMPMILSQSGFQK